MNKQKINELNKKSRYTIDDLREITKLLRAPDGCPWDRVQTHKSIRRDLIEETYEVAEAIDRDSSEMMCEELGDLLLQVVFHADLASDEGRFNLDDVADGICKKLILRHPHIFADVSADTTEQVLTNWDKIKKVEKNQKSDREVLDAVSHALPSLMRAEKLAGKSVKLGIDSEPEAAFAELAGRLDNLSEPSEEAGRVIGELLYKTAALAKRLGVDSEKALADECDRVVLKAKD